MGIVTTYRRAFNAKKLDPYPIEILKRVDRPTTVVKEDEVPRLDERESGFNRAARGDFGTYLSKERHRFVAKHPLSGALVNMQFTLSEIVDGVTAANKALLPDDPGAMARHIKETAYFLRADLVGICELPPYAVYSHDMETGEPVELDHPYVISIIVDQDYKTASATVGNDWISNSMSFVAYSTSGFIACILADYIRRLGYCARAHHARNYQVVVPPILLWAGIGEMSRIGDIVVSPFLGPRFKASVVTTDLPLAVDKPIDFGLQDFCTKCMQCARYCPSGAISFGEKVMLNGYEKWPNDVEKCTAQRVGNKEGAGCGVCVAVCPWNKPYTPFHRFVGWTMRNIPVARRFAAWGDEFMGYVKPKLEHKWWFDLEDVDGVLTVPEHAGCRGNNKPE
ncbi:MAG: reductive dehalogenase [Deltaproteobacteria bacterium]|nr:MAG: reductive dehalogenase [Deltaproteobacteria bacterium]